MTKKFSAMKATSAGVLMAFLTPEGDFGSGESCHRKLRFGAFSGATDASKVNMKGSIALVFSCSEVGRQSTGGKEPHLKSESTSLCGTRIIQKLK